MRITPLIAAVSALVALPVAAEDEADGIVVEGRLKAIERQVESLTNSITRRPPVDKPLSRQYGSICIGVSGLSPQFAMTLIKRVEDNARDLGIRIRAPDCQVNTLIAFAADSRAEVQRLRKEQPTLFSTLLDYEFDRVLRGSGAVQAWQATEVKGADGKEFASATLGGRDFQINDQPFASHLTQQLRVDIAGAIVVFDTAFVPGKSIQQLADYATMRLFAPTHDASAGGVPSLPTILSLFAPGAEGPPGLTEFDRAYLTALYRLPPTARGAALSDAAWAAYRRSMDNPQATRLTD